jgi:hypothetical protein
MHYAMYGGIWVEIVVLLTNLAFHRKNMQADEYVIKTKIQKSPRQSEPFSGCTCKLNCISIDALGLALVAWSYGIISAVGVMGREI